MSFFNALKGAAKGAQANRNLRSSQQNQVNQQQDGEGSFCVACGTQGKPKSFTPGSILIELVAWCCFLVPGLIYSLWRLNRRRHVCAACGGEELIPADSPKARAAKRAMSQHA